MVFQSDFFQRHTAVVFNREIERYNMTDYGFLNVKESLLCALCVFDGRLSGVDGSCYIIFVGYFLFCRGCALYCAVVVNFTAVNVCLCQRVCRRSLDGLSRSHCCNLAFPLKTFDSKLVSELAFCQCYISGVSGCECVSDVIACFRVVNLCLVNFLFDHNRRSFFDYRFCVIIVYYVSFFFIRTGNNRVVDDLAVVNVILRDCVCCGCSSNFARFHDIRSGLYA